MRRHGVGRFRAGELSIAGGGFAGGSCLVRSQDGAAWVMSNGDLSGNPGPSITCLGDGLGDESRHSLAYPPASAFNAIWVDENNLVTIGNSGFLITNLASGITRTINAAQSNPMGATNFSDNVVLTVGNSVCVGLTDLATGKYAEIAHLALRPSVNEIAMGPDNHFYLASYYGDGHMPIAVVDVSIDVPISDFVPAAMAEANRGDLSAYVAEVDQIRADTTPVERETKQQRLERLYNEALQHVNRSLLLPLQRAVEPAGLRPRIFEERSLDGWPPNDYGGASSLPRWGIETLCSPWLAASIGVVHRAQSTEDLEELAVTVVLARMTPHGQHTYLNRFERFEPGTSTLIEITDRLHAEIEGQLPSIIENFLAECRTAGILR